MRQDGDISARTNYLADLLQLLPHQITRATTISSNNISQRQELVSQYPQKRIVTTYTNTSCLQIKIPDCVVMIVHHYVVNCP
jgi:hypothetical protein